MFFSLPPAQIPTNPGIVQVSAKSLAQYKRVVALSDVHGMYEHATTLLQAAKIIDNQHQWVGGRTLLVITGDSIDKGPQSLEVLALWMRLQEEAPKQGGRVIVLLGNHEAEMLADPVGDTKTKELDKELTRLGIHVPEFVNGSSEKPFQGISLRRYSTFLRSLPVAARVGDWLFCHAGWLPAATQNTSLAAPQARWDALVAREKNTLTAATYSALLSGDGDEFLERKEYPEGTKWWRTPEAFTELEHRLDSYGLKGVVFGHSPTAFEISDGIGYHSPQDHRLIKIDSGMAPEAGGFAGHLLLFPNPKELSQTSPTNVHALVGSVTEGVANGVLKTASPQQGN
jgi:hypothetical protein